MDKKKIFIFDMDGVIIDSVDSLLGLYGDFLIKFDKKYHEDELKAINGMKIAEIVEFMKQTHELKEDAEFLTREYDKDMKERYTHVLPVKWIKETVSLLSNSFTLCVASSSKRENIEYILNKFGLKKYFSLIVSGDDVPKAKPSPEIYQKVMQKYGEREYYVIEDSINGIIAAKKAGAKTIFYNHIGKTIESKADYEISNLLEIGNLLLEIDTNIKILEKINDIKFVLKDYELKIDMAKKEQIDKIWDNQLKTKPNLFNGRIASYLSHKKEGGKVVVNYFLTDYKYYLAKLLGKVDIDVYPLAVNGITFNKEGKFIVAKRSGVSEYDGYWEFVPSGGINLENIKKIFPHKEQIVEELYEEIGEKVDMGNIYSFYFFFDPDHSLYSVGCLIEIDRELTLENFKKEEYSEFKIMDKKDVGDFIENNNFVPISKVIFGLLNDT